MAVSTEMAVFWVVAPYRLVYIYPLKFKFKLIPAYTALKPKRQPS
jgi:hypothetical protein